MKLSAMAQEFLHAKANGLRHAGQKASELTVKSYGNQLARAERIMGVEMGQASQEDIDNMLETLRTGTLSTAYTNQLLSACRGFYYWALRAHPDDIGVKNDPFMGVHMSARAKNRVPKLIDEQQFKSIIEAIQQADDESLEAALSTDRRMSNALWTKDEGRTLKKTLPLKLMFYGGLRIAEAVSIRKDHVQRGGVIVHGKGGKERFVPLPAWLLDELQDFIGEFSDPESRYVFTPYRRADNADSEHISTSGIHHAFKQATRDAGMPNWVTPHVLRHSYATQALRRTNRLDIVSDLLGHENIETTRIYAKNLKADIIDQASSVWD